MANKSELYYDQRVDNKEGRNFAKKIGAIFQIISTISDIGVNDLFYNIGRTYLTGNKNYYWEKEKETEEKVMEIYMKKKEEQQRKMKLGKKDNVKSNKGNKKNCIII